VSTKAIVCRCEDVTLGDIQHTIALGYKSVEEVKRYTGLGTGPCEGKECMAHAARLCAAAGSTHLDAFTSRPPIEPVPLSIFAFGALGPDGTGEDDV
jgi:NAD(P)H-nitrite reductase large subunit